MINSNAQNNVQDKKTQSAWVVFCGETDIRWLRILKKGFRHCYILLNDGQRWFSLDPLSSYTDIQIYHHIEVTFNLPQWLEKRGFQVIPAAIQHHHRTAAPCMAFTCVEAIKRVLGIHRRFIITPWQLYCFLKKSLHEQQSIHHLKGEFSWAH